MRRVRPSCGVREWRSWEEAPLLWFTFMVAVTALLSLAVAAALSLGADHLLPSNEPFIPHFTT